MTHLVFDKGVLKILNNKHNHIKILESGMDKAPTVEKNGKTVTQNYEGLLDQYHPTLTKESLKIY